MNNRRRQQLKQALTHLNEASAIVGHVRDDEQDALDSLPENLQDSERARSMEIIIDNLDDIASDIHSVIDDIEHVEE